MPGGVLAAVTTLVLLLAAASPAQAASICWGDTAPAVGGEWNTPENWNGGAVPGADDTAILNASGAGCSSPSAVLLSGAAAEVALVRQATTEIVVDGTSLSLTGTSTTDFLGSVHVRNGGSLTIAAGASISIAPLDLVNGTSQITLGNPGTGSLQIDGTLRTATEALDVTDEPDGGGTVAISANGDLRYEPGSAGEIHALFDNGGHVTTGLGSQLAIFPSAGSPESTGGFAIGDQSKLALKPIRGSTMVASGSIAGTGGHLEIDASVGPDVLVGTVSVPASATLAVGQLTIGPTSALDLGAAGSTGQLVMTKTAERRGGGALTAGAANLSGGVLSGGTTNVTGAAAIAGDAVNPTIRGGAKLRTEGATTWSGGSVTLGGAGTAGTWENAGTLTINNADTGSGKPDLSLVSGDPAGVLRNLAGATIDRGAPAGTMFGVGRIENAGTVNVQAGTLGEPAPGAAGAYVQTLGLTTVSQGATLSMNATLIGGTLRGSGTVRNLVNSGGTVAPGTSPGALTVVGDFSQGPGGTLAEEIAGALDAQYDRLLVGGAASLGGTLAIATDPGYVPAPQSIHHFLTAASVSGTFASLTGAQAGDGEYSADYLADEARLCFAGCVKIQRTLSVDVSGSGSVTSSPVGVNCRLDCTEAYDHGTVVTLSPAPSVGHRFTAWSGDCAGSGACLVTMDQARSVTATFSPLPRTLEVSVVGNGSVASEPAGIDCVTDCTEDYGQGTIVTLTPSPGSGYQFAGWSGVCTGTGKCSVTMDAAKSTTATFSPVQRSLTVGVVGSGSVTSAPAGIDCGATCSQSYAEGTVVTLASAASAGQEFTGWSGGCTGTGACVVTMYQEQSVTATFTAKPPAVQLPLNAAPGTTSKPKISAKGVIFLPSTNRCVRRRRLSLRVRVPTGLTGRRATVVVRGRQRKSVGQSGLGRRFNVTTPRSGPFTAKVTLSLTDGRTVSASGRYRACS